MKGLPLYLLSRHSPDVWGLPNIRDTFRGPPNNKDYSISGLYWGSPIWGNYHMIQARQARHAALGFQACRWELPASAAFLEVAAPEEVQGCRLCRFGGLGGINMETRTSAVPGSTAHSGSSNSCTRSFSCVGVFPARGIKGLCCCGAAWGLG